MHPLTSPRRGSGRMGDKDVTMHVSPPFLNRRQCLLHLAAGAATLSGCGGGGSNGSTPAPEPEGEPIEGMRVVTVAQGLQNPWGLAFLPDGRLLLTERAGAMRIIGAGGSGVGAAIAGLPAVVVGGQGGLLDVALDPDFGTTPWIYWSYVEGGGGGTSGTAVARGQLVGNTMTGVSVLYRQVPKVVGTGHFGGRLAFAPDGRLLITLGERMLDDPSAPSALYAQNLGNSLGKVVRLERDGSIPPDNPNLGGGALPELFSFGLRNPQGAAIHPATGDLWVADHGPQGGDEVNLIQPADNHGWPLVSYGCPYGSPVGNACWVNGGTHAPSYVEPLTTWTPTSTAPSGMAFYTGSRYPSWTGQLFVGSLAGQTLWRLTLSGNTITSRTAMFTSRLGRIRDVKQGSDGWLYLLTDEANGRVLRLET